MTAPTPTLVTKQPILGYVEVAAADAIMGWAWSPDDSSDRVSVELHLDGVKVAHCVADGMREDLERNGIGDGRHAFRLAVPPSLRARAEAFQVFARLDGGEAVLLGAPAPPESISERLDRLQVGLDMVVASQRALHRHFEKSLLKTEADNSLQIAHTQFQALEVFVLRLDEHLAKLVSRRPASTAANFPRIAGVVALIGVLVFCSVRVWISVRG